MLVVNINTQRVLTAAHYGGNKRRDTSSTAICSINKVVISMTAVMATLLRAERGMWACKPLCARLPAQWLLLYQLMGGEGGANTPNMMRRMRGSQVTFSEVRLTCSLTWQVSASPTS